jgi:hypothetical protein
MGQEREEEALREELASCSSREQVFEEIVK